jgi:ribosomal protein L11 methyltransferase
VIRLAVRVPRERSELVLAELLDLAPGGVEEVSIDDRTVEYAVYGAPGELPGLPDLQALAGGSLVALSTSEVADDWQERWREFHRPVVIEPPVGAGVPALRVRPPWEPAASPDSALLELVIDPGQAFGTGAHATTRLCLELLLALRARGGAGAVLDVGTGSGVLAIAAALLGFGPVAALDNERESVQAALDNAAANGVAITVARLDLRAEPLPASRGVVLANLLRPLLADLAGALAQQAPSHLLAGGLLEGELDEVTELFERRNGLVPVERRTRDGWGAIWLAAS